MSSHLLPPRKRDWTPGTYQVGLFIRFPGGEQIALTVDDTKPEEAKATRALLKRLTRPTKDRR